MSIIKVKRGLQANLPILENGEIGYTTDKNGFYVGNGTANIPVNSCQSATGSAHAICYVWIGTQAAYDAIVTKSDDTVYFIR